MSHKKHRPHIKVGKDAEEEEDEAITSPVTFEMSIQGCQDIPVILVTSGDLVRLFEITPGFF